MYNQLMRAAYRADQQGDTEAARKLVQAAQREAKTAAPQPAQGTAAPEPKPVPAEETATPVEPPTPSPLLDLPTFEVGAATVVDELPPELPRAELPTTPATFEAPEATEERLRNLVDERVQQALEARGPLVPDPSALEARARQRAEDEQARQRERMVIAGREDRPVEPTAFLPMGRPSRISEQRVRQQADEAFPGFLTEQTERLYRDPETGELRRPTVYEELVETFAAQPVMTEAEARAADEALRQQKADIQARREAGEDVGLWERASPYVTEAFQWAATSPQQTGGVYESATAATLRSVPAFLSAALREGYFSGLGYDVDPEGNPVDPTDFGYQLAQAREAVGLPAVATRGPGGVPLAFPVPLPGVAVEAERQRDAVGTDPLARRQRPDVEVPSFTEDPAGFFEGEARRVLQTIQGDRGLGDDFVDSPDVRQAYVELYGSPDAAFWGGTLGDVLIPAGPGTAYRSSRAALSALGRAATETPTARRAAEAAITAAEANTASRAERSMLNAAADVAAIVVPGRASDGRVVRVVADKVLDVTPGFSDAQRATMKAAVKQGSDTPAQVVRDMARAVGQSPSDDAFRRMLTEVELRTPDDLVMVSEAVAVPRKVAAETRRVIGEAVQALQRAETPSEQAAILRRYEMPAYARRVEEAGGLDALEPRVQNALREQVKLQAAYRAVPDIADAVRKADKVSEFNSYVERLAVLRPGIGKGAYGPLMRRIAAIYGSKAYQVTPASVAKTATALRAAGKSVARQVRQALKAEAKTTRSAEQALDNVFAREVTDMSTDAMYSRLLGELYGPENVPNLLAALKQDDLTQGLRLVTDVPTVAKLRQIDELAVANGYVRAKGPAPEVERAMLRAIIEEGVRKRVALDGKAFEAALFGERVKDVAASARAASPEGAGGFFRVPERLDPQAGAPGSRARFYRAADPATERKLAESVDELVQVIANEPGIGRFGWGDWYAAHAGRLGQSLRDSEYAMRYGYYLPNLPYLTGRLMALPIVSLATIGAENTLRALARQAGKVIPEGVPLFPRSRRTGLGVTDPDGVYYSPKVLDDLLELHGGLGATAIDQARAGRLARDILRDVERAASPALRRGMADASVRPDVVNFWMRTAEAVELSYRRSVFEAGVANGMLPSDAAILARRSLFDYGEVPGALTNTVGQLFADAGEMYLYVLEFARLVARNPEQATRIAKATRARQRQQDRYGLEGDRTLKALGIVPAGREGQQLHVYGPDMPQVRPVEKTLDLLRSADFVVQRLAGVAKATGRADYSGALDTGLEGAGEVIRYGASELLPGVLDALEAAAGAELGAPGAPRVDLAQLDDTAAFWAALLAADYADPRHEDGTWNTAVDILDPQQVVPPKELAVPGEPSLWAVQPPEGTPFLALGQTRDGVPRYFVFEPSQRGLRNLQAVRGLTPDVLEQALGMAASLYGSTNNVDVEAVFPSGPAAAAGRALGGRAALTRDEDVLRARQTEAIRAVREDVR